MQEAPHNHRQRHAKLLSTRGGGAMEARVEADGDGGGVHGGLDDGR